MAKVTMPQLGESVAEGTIGKWLKGVGDRVEKYEPLVEVITDKVNAEVPSPFAGTLAAILVPEGATVPNNAEIAEIDETGARVAERAAVPIAPEPVVAGPTAAVPAPPAAVPLPPGEGGRMTPAVRRLARELGVELARVPGTGQGGRITREDVLAFAAGAGAAPATPPPAALPAAGPDEELVPLVTMRRRIAEHMVRAKTSAPHAYTCIEIDMSGIVAAREAARADYEAGEGIPLSFVPFVVRATVAALGRHPDLNAHWTEQGLLRKRRINVGIAVALENGLIVPVVKDAERLSIDGLNRAIRDLAERARAGRLRLEDVQGGTVTVNNTGWFGSVWSQPILNVPQVVIVSMEAIVRRPVVVQTPGGEAIAIRPMMNLCASFDHRATDGAQVGAFLQDLRRELEAIDTDTPIR